MRKMRRNNLMFNKAVMSKVAASAVAAAAVAIPMAAPLMAANAYDTNKQEFANNLSAPKMNKYLIMKRDANVPNVTFDFTITTTGVEPIPATSTTLAVYKGDDATKVSGQPVLSNNGAVTFACVLVNLGGNIEIVIAVRQRLKICRYFDRTSVGNIVHQFVPFKVLYIL